MPRVAASARNLIAVLPAQSWWLLLAGGVCYTGGVGFYLWNRLRYHHAIWHLWVLGGSTCHFLAVLYSVGSHAT